KGASLKDANLGGVDLSGADLRGAIITQTQLDWACGTNVELDPGLSIKPCP
ncbi:MAG: pentapeptide repeat-containing protein, partial [Alphaproteobacteria bacterium]|nr:pentapeptide repeat-containing protein [Alphaproteobacteria bacterium]